MSDSDRAKNLADDLAACLVALDELGANIAAAHLDAALNALRRQFNLPEEISTTD
ncbi:hypothetical protein [Novosphingobium sp. 9U]|uniref:hypothetical protein n=1 Tax=Novosphingobium sp. 9U TaxID=2653158 RepID=UPI001F3D0C90|nr:hypothetical protein [Novosphingobium sp. 9U]